MYGKKVFLVTGSEDGELGIYTNCHLAFTRASQYVKESYNNPEIDTNYQKVLQGCKGWGCYVRSKTTDIYATITVFKLNY